MFLNRQTSPKAVAEAIFDAAKTGNYRRLSTLIDAHADGNSRRIARVQGDIEIARQFRLYFSEGRVTGPATIDGNQAQVQIFFGLGGIREETLKMIRRGGRWYLQSF